MFAQIDKDSFVPGEDANVIFQVDNQSDTAFTEVRVRLTQYITLRAGTHVQQAITKLTETTFPGVNPFTTLKGEKARRLRITLPAALLPTTYAATIQCSYKLVVKCSKAEMFVSDVVLKVPLIVRVPPPSAPVLESPPGWHPQVCGAPVRVTLPAASPVPPRQLSISEPQDLKHLEKQLKTEHRQAHPGLCC